MAVYPALFAGRESCLRGPCRASTSGHASTAINLSCLACARPIRESPCPFEVEHVIACQGKTFQALRQLKLKHHQPAVAETHFRTCEIELPHAAEAFVVEGGGLGPVPAE